MKRKKSKQQIKSKHNFFYIYRDSKKVKKIKGNIEIHRPVRVSEANLVKNFSHDKWFNCLVEFEETEDNIVPEPSWIFSPELRKIAPQIFIDFLLNLIEYEENTV